MVQKICYNNIEFDYSSSNICKVIISFFSILNSINIFVLIEGAWRNTTLQVEVSNLSKIGYVCYIIGRTGVIRVSHCWNEKFNVRHNNLLCVSSKDRQLMNNIDEMKLLKSIPTTCQKKRTR